MCTAMDIFEERMKKIGYAQGVKEIKETVITNMIDYGMSVDEIVKYTNINKEEVLQYLTV